MVKFLDLKKINDRQRQAIDAATSRVLNSGWYLLGNEDHAFEEAFAAYCGVKHCVSCANGLDALKLIIQAYGIGPGDEVIVPANTYIASIMAISANGATPVLVEPCAALFADTTWIGGVEMTEPISTSFSINDRYVQHEKNVGVAIMRNRLEFRRNRHEPD